MQNNGAGLIEFLDYAARSGLMNGHTVASLKSAAREVLEAVSGEGWEGVDLSAIETEDYASRFARLRPGKYKPASIVVYQNRFRKAVATFQDYLSDPGAWRAPPGRQTVRREIPKSKPAARRGSTPPSPPASGPPLAVDDGTQNVDYPFPLRPGMLVRLRLPSDLSKQEARRLAAFLDSVAVDTALETGSDGGASTEPER